MDETTAHYIGPCKLLDSVTKASNQIRFAKGWFETVKLIDISMKCLQIEYAVLVRGSGGNHLKQAVPRCACAKFEFWRRVETIDDGWSMTYGHGTEQVNVFNLSFTFFLHPAALLLHTMAKIDLFLSKMLLPRGRQVHLDFYARFN